MELVDLYPDAGRLELSAVERAPDGLPRAWPILREGDNPLTIRGQPANLKLTHDDLAGIVAYHAAKGAKIPIDSRHVISNLAVKVGLDESDILRRLPRLAGTAGFGRLEQRDGALMLSDVEWLPIAADVMREGMIRYYSPTIQGLDGKSPLRVTSVSLDNEPCLQNIASLACSESAEEINVATPDELRALLNPKGGIMPDDPNDKAALAATPQPSAPDGEIMTILKEILGDDVTPDKLKAVLAALKTKADAVPGMQDRIKALECAEESRKLEVARSSAMEKGKLTPAMLQQPFFANMTSAQLSEYSEAVPDGIAAPVGTLQLSEHRVDPPKPSTPFHESNPVRDAISAAVTTNME